MTNKTEMAELNEICEILNNYGYEPDCEGEGVHINNAAKAVLTIIEQHCESSKMLEAAEARITEVEADISKWDMDARVGSRALQKVSEENRKLRSELTALRGAVVPVAVVEWSDYIVFGQPPRVAVRELSPGALELAMGKSLFTHAQPVPVIRAEHAEWSQATFGDVGPVGPLKHLSKEAIEAAEAPDDLSEWADMQFLLWDAQRRAGITDAQIEQAMIEKLAINKARTWPAPKDGEPRLHVKSADGEGE